MPVFTQTFHSNLQCFREIYSTQHCLLARLGIRISAVDKTYLQGITNRSVKNI